MSLKIAVCQINSTVGDLKENGDKIVSYYREACKKGADLAIFPECALCGYPPEDLLLRSSFLKSNEVTLKKIAKEIKETRALIGFAHREKDKIYNSCALLGNGKILSIYSKRDLPNYGVFDEKRYFTPGTGLGLIKIKGQLLGISICEDIWTDSSENIYLKQAKKGAELLINISASPYHAGKFKSRYNLLRRRALQTHLPILYVNLVGGQDELVFDGRSFAVDRYGKIVLRAKSFEEDIKIFQLSPVVIPAKAGIQKDNFTGLDSRFRGNDDLEPLSQEIEDIYAALRLGTRDYVEKNGFKSVLIGLSGGIDSALTAAIASDALGPQRVLVVTMPSPYTSNETLSDSKKLAENLKIKILTLPIHALFDSYLKALESSFLGKERDITEENLQSRIRGTLLMALSNKFGSLVLTTGNKSEVSVGYSTLYGDTAGGFAVIKDISKTMVYKLSEYINKKAGREVIPQSTIDRPPTAELKENQRDQDTLPPYDILDRMIQGYVEEDKGFEALSRKGFDPELLKKVIHMIDMSEYKRRQSPPGIKMTPKAFGRDRRMPITNKYKEA